MVIEASKSLDENVRILPVFDLPTISRNKYTATVVRTKEHFDTLENEWETLLERSNIANISLHHAWLSHWLEVFPPEALFVILIRDEQGELHGAAPFLITRNRTGIACRSLRRLQFIGTSPDLYDWMEILIHPEADTELITQLVGNEIIRHRHQWDLIDLRFFANLGQLMTLELQLNPILWRDMLSQLTTLSFIDLPSDWLEYQNTLRKKKYHKDLNRIHNNIQKDFDNAMPTLIVHPPGPETDKVLKSFLESHQQYWLDRGSRTEYDRHRKILDFYKIIHREFSEGKAIWRPVFEFTTLQIGERVISYHFDIQTREGATGCLCSYDPEVKKYRPGVLHIEAIIERTQNLGGRRFTFGRGDEAYKNQWKIEKKPLWHFMAFRTKFSHMLWQFDNRLREFRKGVTPVEPTVHPNPREEKDTSPAE